LRKKLFYPGLAICFSLFIFFLPRAKAQQLFLDSLIAEALRANPNLKSAQFRYETYLAKVPQDGSLPNPMFQTTFSNISTKSWTLGKAPMSGIEFMLSQTIPFPGKLGLMKDMTKNMAEKTKKDYESTKNFILSELKQNYYQLYVIDKSIEITQENKLLSEDFAKIASLRYSVGQGLQQDVLKAQVQVSKIIEELIALEEMRKSTQAKINILLNHNPQDSLGKPQELFFKNLNYSEEELQNLAIQNNPFLLGAEFMIGAAKSDYRLAQREVWPDLAFSLSYMRMKNDSTMAPQQERNFVSASVGIELPLYFWAKQKNKVKEKSLNLESSRQEYEGMKNNLKADVSMFYYSLNKYKKEIELLNTVILPQAKQSLESAKSGYQVDKVDFLTLLDNQTTLYNYQIVFHQTLSSYYQTLAKLEEMTGKPLF
jgi:cobalt-zinc-cadmium efflux system outer membrane protein